MTVVLAVAAAVWLLVIVAVDAAEVEYVELDTGLGRVRGFRETVHGTEVDSFLGIPFAKPPVGEMRFRRPENVEPWDDVLDATYRPKSCYQTIDTAFDKFEGVDMWNANTNMSEDCLYLNIWAPGSRTYGKGSLRPVMVWIYGGGFYGGTSTLDLYDGRTFAAINDVIVLSMQYRVGALGFMYLGTEEAPGNMGLVDQMKALEWLFNYIESFGGDSSRVTLFGESAGAVSVSLHLLAPLSQNLFQYAIMESGSALCRWAVEPPSMAMERTLQIAARAGCSPTDPVNDVIKCLRDKEAANLTLEMWSLQDDHNLITPMLATIDNYFLREMPKDSVRNGNFKQTNILLGANKDEGSYFLLYGVQKLFQNVNMTRKDYQRVVSQIVNSDEDVLADTIDFEYRISKNYQEHRRYRDILDDVIGDLEFICPVVEFANAYSLLQNDVYLYQFLHDTTGNPWPTWMGVMHGYEIDHVFGLPLNKSYTYTPQEEQLSRKVMSYWSNFAKTGDPNRPDPNKPAERSTWTPYTVSERSFLKLDTVNGGLDKGLRYRKCEFWRLMPKLEKALEGEVCAACTTIRQSSLLALGSLLLVLHTLLPRAC